MRSIKDELVEAILIGLALGISLGFLAYVAVLLLIDWLTN